MELGQSESWSIRAAEGWLGLGCIREAKAEIRTIPRPLRSDPMVLAVRFDIYAAAGKWKVAGRAARMITKVLPDVAYGWLQVANAVHHMKRTELARDLLSCIAHEFPDEFLIPYRLACYCCQLGDFRESWEWLKLAMKIGGKAEVQLLAKGDPELLPLWKQRCKRPPRRRTHKP